jgi:hypothetical protein
MVVSAPAASEKVMSGPSQSVAECACGGAAKHRAAAKAMVIAFNEDERPFNLSMG